ncbi:MAG: InlB B-repeat-containing protein [Paludibacteraceae bacterium]|nr:InlB B-repeat-containing protein [Paludibacteraceae bacterium]
MKKTNFNLKSIVQKSARWLLTLIALLTLGVEEMWGDKTIWEWKLYYWDGSSNQWLGGDNNTGDLDFGVVNDNYYWKGAWAKTSDNNSNSVKVYYVEPDGTEANFSLTYQNCWDNCYNKWWKNESGCNLQLTSSSFYKNNPGVNTIQFYVQIDGGNKLTPKATYTIPGFTNLSTTSVTFDNTVVNSTNDKSITYTHYGTAPTNVAACYSITGTNADQFSITALSGTGATIRFSPTSAGIKTATLVIKDVHGKQTASISLSGTTKAVVTYKAGDYSTGSDMTADKVYGTNLTLKDKGDFTRTGYTQTAWNTGSNGTSGTNYNLKATYSTNAALTLYPTWTVNSYNITYSPSTPSHCTYTTAPSSANYGSTVNLKIDPDANYVISSVTVKDANNNTVAVSGSSPNYSFTMPASNVTVTIVTALSSITVNYGAGANGSLAAKQGGVSIGASGSTVDGGSTVNFTATPDTYYEVEGWYTNAACTEGKHDAGSTTYDAVANSTLNVYVKFKLIDYAITYTLNGGTNSGSNPETYTYETATITLQDPSRNYYTFAGWYTSSTFTAGTEITSIPLHSSGAMHVYAKWTENMTSVSLAASPTGAGTFKIGSTAVTSTTAGKSTTRSVTAVAVTGYYVKTSSTVWTKSNSNITLSSTTANPTTVTGCGTAGTSSTLTATFTEKYLLCGSINADGNPAGGMRGWSTSGDNSAYQSAVYNNGVLTIQANLTSAATQYKFKLYNQQGSAWKGQSNEGGSMSDGAQWTFNGTYDVYFTTTVAGVYTFTIDQLTESSPRVRITFPGEPEHTATLAVHSSGHGTTTPAAGSITLKEVTTTTITANPDPGYRFKQWNVTGSCAVASTTSATTTATASGDGGRIEAEFTNDGFVYFDRSAVSGVWSGSDVYMTCLNSSDLTWDGSTGTLVVKNWVHDDVHNKKMSRIPNTNIYYYDCSGHLPAKILFTDKSHAGDNYKLWQMAAVVEWDNVDLSKDNMFVVENYVWQSKNNTGYFEGYWMKYNETSSGIQLLMWTYGDAVVSGTPVTFTTANAGDREFTASVTLSATTGYKFKVKGLNGREYGNSGTMTNTNCTGWDFLDRTNSDCNFTSTGAGTYKFTLNCTNSGKLKVSLDFPLDLNDYRVVYNGKIKTTAGSKTDHASNFIRHLSAAGTKKDIVSFYVTGSDWTLRLQKCTKLSPLTWEDQGSAISAATFGSPAQGVHNFEVKQVHNGSTNTVTITYIEPYTGNYYIRTDVASGGWEAFKTTPDNKMEYSDYSKEHSGYDYYHCHWTPTGKNVRFCVANDYSQNVSETMTTGDSPFNWENLPYQANVRFMYNSNTNVIGRAYLNGSSEGGNATFLWLQGSTGANKRILRLDGSDFPSDTARFGDDGNWIYRRDLKAEEGARIKLISNYYYSNTNHYQYFKGTSDAWSDASTEQILGGDSPTTAHTIRVIYDFKTNHLLSAWLVDDETVSSAKAINTSVMIVREHQGDAKQLTFSGSGKLTAVDTVYCVMQFNKTTLNNASLSIYERALYWISFPFDVKLNDVFGFGTYGEHWIMEYYDGKGRAANGFWAESDVNWKYIMPAQKKDYILKAYEGYVLCLDLDNLTTSSSVWNYVDKVSLYFPSAKSVGSIITRDTTITIDQTGYECTINRTVDASGNSTGLPANYDRTKRDSYWHCIGVPSYANNTHSYTTGFINDATDSYYYPSEWTADNLPFYYAWNSSTNALSPQRTGSSTTFKAMNSYLVQYSKTTMAWTSTIVSPKPSSVVARRKAAADDTHLVEFNIHLLNGEKDIDHTYIRLTDEEEVTSGFEFGHDLTKAFNAGANIYTIVDQVEVAGNSLPLEYDKTTLVPMGVKIATEGEYSFSLPEGTSGVGVTLIDNELQTRTNLALMDYAVTLPAGDHNERFVLEISPIEQTTTSVETVNGANGDAALNGVCKKLIDGVLYIVKDGKVFDARGARIQ